ncbi:hypothetical protein OTU49_000886 [Cherax quadricarinatus]|uniref:Cytochrome P450 n=1 Tax=Cherax quadricarinatus TaxID=27406 RepID=A0AAW0XXM9_CHEQU
MVVVVVLTVVVVVVTAVLAYSKHHLNYWASRGVPTAPGALPILGHMPKFISKKYPRWLYVDEVYRSLGSSTVCGFYEMLKPTLMIADPELVKAVLIKDFDHFVDRRIFNFTSDKDEILNEMLTQASGTHWKGIRSVLSPTFTSGRMKGMYPLVEKKADALLDYIHRELKTKTSIKLKKCFGLYTLEVISSCAFGMDTNSLKVGHSTFNTQVENIFKTSTLRMIKVIFFFCFPKLSSILKMSFTQPEVLFFEKVVTETIKQREAGEKRGDFLDIMMESRDDQSDPNSKTSKYPLKMSTIVAESILFILAGYDTTANMLSIVSFLLAQHRSLQQRLRQEMREIAVDGTFTYQGVMEAKYLDAFISEALRLYPVAHFTERQCTKPYTVPGTKVVLTEKSVIGIPIWSLHHDPRYWSDPETFSPDRFLPHNKDQIKSGTYLPFGLGPRNCIGMRFAMMEAKLVLAKILLHYEITCVPGQDTLTFSEIPGLMRPSEDLSLVFTPITQE